MNLTRKLETYADAHYELVLFINDKKTLDVELMNQYLETLFNARVEIQKVLDKYILLMHGWVKSKNIPTAKCIDVFKDLKMFHSQITNFNTFSGYITKFTEMENTLMYKVHDQANELYEQCIKVETCSCGEHE